MSIYIIVWFLISAFLLGFWVWSGYMSYKQKKAWRFFADKKKMRYHSAAFFQSPTISGVVDEYSVSVFPGEHEAADTRFSRNLTAIEVNLHSKLPTRAAIGSGGMVNVIDALGLMQEFKPPVKGWDDSYIIRCEYLGIAQNYLNDDRLNILINLMRLEKAWVIVLFNGSEGLLRLDTPRPIDTPKEMDVLVKQMITVAKALELNKGEERDLLREESLSAKTSKVLDIDDDLLDDHLGIELEEDDVELPASKDKKSKK